MGLGPSAGPSAVPNSAMLTQERVTKATKLLAALGELLEPLSGDIEKMNEIIAHADLLIKSRGLDEKLTESKERSGSTIIKIVHNSIEIIREGEMKNTDIFSITRRWGFELA